MSKEKTLIFSKNISKNTARNKSGPRRAVPARSFKSGSVRPRRPGPKFHNTSTHWLIQMKFRSI